MVAFVNFLISERVELSWRQLRNVIVNSNNVTWPGADFQKILGKILTLDYRKFFLSLC